MLNNELIEKYVPWYLLHSEDYSLVITDLEGRYIFVNEVFRKRFSFICEDFIGQPAFIAIYPEDHATCLKAVEECLANPDKIVKVILRKPDTTLQDFYWTSWEFSVLKDKQANPIGIICLGHDITETEKASRQAKSFAQKVDTIIEEITDGFYQLDKNWVFTKINKVAEQTLGFSRDYLLGKCLWDVFPDSSNFEYPSQYRKAMQEGLTVTFEDYRPDIDQWYSVVAYPSVEGLTVFFRNITQQKKAQQALEISQNRLKAILDSTNDINLLVSPDYKVLNFNKITYEVFLRYYKKELFLGADIRDYFQEEDTDLLNRYFSFVLGGEKFSLEIERVTEGKKLWFELTYMPVYDTKGQILGCNINLKDITEKKLTEIKLRQQEFILQAIYQSTTEANGFVDKELKVRYVNQMTRIITKQIFGREIQIGDESLDFVLPEYRAEFEEYYKRVFQGEKIVVEKSGRQSDWWQFSLFPVYDEFHNIIGIAYNVLDITERKRKEEQLKESELKLQRTIEAIPHPLLIVGEGAIIHYVNEEFEKVFGYKENEIVGKTIDILIPERFRIVHRTHYENYMKQEPSKSMRMGRFIAALTKDGKEIAIDASLNCFTTNHQKFVIAILQDVSELKKRQSIILKQNQILRKIAWQQSHELRGPVATILGLCDLLKNYREESEKMKELYLNHLIKTAQELDLVVKKIVQQTNEVDFGDEEPNLEIF
ncbi:MAG: PAS domain S-box protein [Cytophagales bacterium]|nr:PAS domain S-box protein [Cytophagales bacterium]MDW8384444.1 PAS domain S-box protein [Flammeovirgaceae bacterium]